MRHILWATLLTWAFAGSAVAQDIRGSGSTAVFSLMTKWSQAYEKTGGARLDYRPVGSAAGLTDIRHRLVDFAASEAPLDSAQLLRDGLLQFPLAIGALVAVVNIDGVSAGQLRLTGPLLADIYFGKVTRWNAPAIAAVNPGLKLPDLKIQVIHRADGSGSSFTLADYLSKTNVEWKARVGASTMLQWPAGTGVRHSSGVVESVARIRGAIGYVEYGNAVRAKLAYALVQNQAGEFVGPGTVGFKAALEVVDWGKDRDFAITLTNGASANAYPIMSVAFAVMRHYPTNVRRARDMRAFLQWTLTNGQDLATALSYVALPPPLLEQIEGYWSVGSR